MIAAFVALILAQNILTFTVTVTAKGTLTTLTHETDAYFKNQNTLDCTPKHTFYDQNRRGEGQ